MRPESMMVKMNQPSERAMKAARAVQKDAPWRCDDVHGFGLCIDCQEAGFCKEDARIAGHLE